MKKYFASMLMVAGLAGGVQTASAAPLGLVTKAPEIGASFAIVDYLEDGFGSADLLSFASVDYLNGVGLDGLATLDFGVNYSLADPTNSPIGGLSVFDDAGLALGGDLMEIGFEEDAIELLFGTLTGSVSGDFGSQALMTIIFNPSLGDANPFDAFVDGDFYEASISIQKVSPVAVVPLPAALPLLLGGLGILGFVGAFKRRQ